MQYSLLADLAQLVLGEKPGSAGVLSVVLGPLTDVEGVQQSPCAAHQDFKTRPTIKTIRLSSCNPSDAQLCTISMCMLRDLASPLQEQSNALCLSLRWNLRTGHGLLTVWCDQDGGCDTAAPLASLPPQPVFPNEPTEHVKCIRAILLMAGFGRK